jgi:hypothetical protein
LRVAEPIRAAARHRQTKGAADMFEPKATASHLDSTSRDDAIDAQNNQGLSVQGLLLHV